MNKNLQQSTLTILQTSKRCLKPEKIAMNKPFEQKLSVLGTKILSCAPMMVVHTLLTRIVVPNTVGRIKHLRIFVLALLSLVYPR